MRKYLKGCLYLTGLILLGIILMSGCVAKHYSKKDVEDKDTAVIHLHYNGTVVEKIDGADARPNAARGLIPIIGGGYFTMARSLSTDKARVLPGEHTIGIAYRTTKWTANPVYMKFVAVAGHEYQSNAVIGEINSAPGVPVEHQTRRWDPFLQDITTGKLVAGSTAILLQTLEPATKPLSEKK